METFRPGQHPRAGRIVSITVDRDDRVWFCHGAGGNGASVYDHGVWTGRSLEETGSLDPSMRSSACDSSGVLWFAINTGVFSYDGLSWKGYTTDNGLAAQLVRSIFVDSSNRKWFAYGSSGGITCFDGETWKTWTVADGLRSDLVTSVSEGKDGTIYACTRGGISRLEGNSWIYVPIPERLISETIFDITETPDGAIWFATACGLSRFDGVSWRTWTVDDGLPWNDVRIIVTLPDGRILLSNQWDLCYFNGESFSQPILHRKKPGRATLLPLRSTVKGLYGQTF